jgi:hypothetical protein
MSSRAHPAREDTYSFDINTDTSAIEVKHGLRAVRGLRDAFVRMVSWLARSPEQRGYLLLIDPAVTDASLERELADFGAAVRPGVAERLHVVVAREGRMGKLPPGIADQDRALLREQVEATAHEAPRLPRADMQSEVLRVLLLEWFEGTGPLTFDGVAKTVGCSYRTVASMVDTLGAVIERTSDRRIRLKRFPADAWARFVAVSERARATVVFVDTSGNPRSPESLVRRLRALALPSVAIGGVMGARVHHSGLDITGTPRLDLCVHAPDNRAGVDFVERIDPGLHLLERPTTPVRLAVHFLRRKDARFHIDAEGNAWADPVECFADLHEARLDRVASEFRAFLTTNAGETR